MGPCTAVCGLGWGIALTLYGDRMSTSVLKVKDKFNFLKLGERQYSNGDAFNAPLILVNVSQI